MNNVINILMLFNGIVILLLSLKRSYITYVFSIINLVIYAWMSISYGYEVEAYSNIILFMPLFISGAISWKRNSNGGVIKVERLTIFEWIVYVLIIILGSFTLRYLFRLTWIGSGHIQPILISLALVCEIMKMERVYEHWYIKGIECSLRLYLILVSFLTGEWDCLETLILLSTLFINFYGAHKWKCIYYNDKPYK